jgi:bifunctional DNA-binding transcriptional regulator/antitoxin component of YhaV-PrlF toxin-antitoxin module
MQWTLEVDEEGTVTFPEDLLAVTGWKAGDTLRWVDNKDGSWNLIKADQVDDILEDPESKNQGC